MLLLPTIPFGFGASIARAEAHAGTETARGTNVVGFRNLQSAELAAMLRDKEVFLVNVHGPYEGEISETDAFIAYDEITAHLDKLPKDKSASIVLYCRSGRMSETAARELVQLGYTQVSHLSGGMVDWKKKGYALTANRPEGLVPNTLKKPPRALS